MMYTIGHEQNYLATIEKHGQIFKWEGGYAFQTIEDAQDEIKRTNASAWCIWEIEGTWETDTTIVEGKPYRVLNKHANIIRKVDYGA